MKKVILLLLFSISFFFCVSAQLKINELMSNNVSAHMDDAYNYSMWVELYNPTISTVQQSSYYFSDDRSIPNKWRSGSKNIAPGGYAVVYFEREERNGHANFKLSPEGGKLYLFNLGLQVVDSVTYPAQYRNISYGRIADGGGAGWVFFEESTPGNSNNGKKTAYNRCKKPVYTLPGGFYSNPQSIQIETPAAGDTIYYTLDGKEPTRQNGTLYVAGKSIYIPSNTVIRAGIFSGNKLPGDIATNSYFINQRNYDLPVISLVTDRVNLYDDMIGIYVQGKNGLPGAGENYPQNWNQDWDRPVNFEYFDKENKTPRLNQELDIAISGGWSRRINAQKSLKISPRKKFGENQLRYDFFPETKPGHKYKDIMLRDSGNDFGGSMLKDAFIQTLGIGRLNLDYQAYQPAVVYINGEYWGIQNIRERTSKDFLYSNYGLDEENIYLLDQSEVYAAPFTELTSYVQNQNVKNANVYETIKSMMDIDNFIDYHIIQMFCVNTDWPHNNLKVWKKREGGKWRWILFDTDFGFSNNQGNNMITYTINKTDNNFNGQGNAKVPSSTILGKLLENETFKNNFIDRFCYHLYTTFDANRVSHILDSLANNIRSEITYHKTRWNLSQNFNNELASMKTFAAQRPDIVLGHLKSYFNISGSTQSIKITSNIENASYWFNSLELVDNMEDFKYFTGRPIKIEANTIPGYEFKHWELISGNVKYAVANGASGWKYWDGNAVPAGNWYASNYSDTSWKTGTAPLGYDTGNNTPITTTIGYGGNASNKYTTAYFRHDVNITNLSQKEDFQVSMFIDDGVVLYINGVETGRYNMPSGALTFNTFSSSYYNGTTTFNIPKTLLKEGLNIIAAEVHQHDLVSTDLVFNLSLSYTEETSSTIYENAVYSATFNGNLYLKAIYEEGGLIDPNENADIVINEIVSGNNIIKDEHGDKDDYIELYNRGEEAVNIAGWYLTDTPSIRTKSQIPTTDSTLTNIPAKGRLIIWADEQPEQGVLHVDFKLGKEGESIVLSRPTVWNTIIEVDFVTFPEMDTNMSYSRLPDGSDNWVVQKPTFNLPNSPQSSTVDNSFSKVRFYPAIVESFFFIEKASGNQLKIHDIVGNLVFEKNLTDNEENLDLSRLAKGMYIVSVGNYSFKIIKT